MQHAVNTTTEDEVFSMWLAYCWATDVFFMDPTRDHISCTEQKQVSRRTRMRMERVLGSQGRRIQLKIVTYCN
jgi:hypothetical protein